MSHTVIGLFDTVNEAQTAADALISNGFSESMVDVGKTGVNDTNTGSSTVDQAENGVSKFFSSLFGNDDDNAKVYKDVANRSGSMVTVHANTAADAQKAAQLMDTHGAIDVHAKAEQYQSMNTAGKSESGTSESPASIKIMEEKLQVGKRVVETGGARIRSRIVERPVEESVRLREEKVRVDRSSVGRPATEADFANFKEGTIEMKEEAEVPVIAKEARIVEEVSLGKEVHEREQIIKDTVRNTEVDIEQLGGEKLTDTKNVNPYK